MPQIKDLLEDVEFIRWVKQPDADLNRYWQHWLEANPDRLADAKFAKEILLNLEFPSKPSTEDAKREVLNRLLSNRTISTSPNTEGIAPYTHRTILWNRMSQWAKVAAILVFSVLITFLTTRFLNTDAEEDQMIGIEWITKSTAMGEKLSFRLSDGSVVWLNAGSSLQYPVSFDSTVRLVKLSGEGFFEVAKDSIKPFKVLSGNLTTTALGTSFNIHSHASKDVKVSLVTGKVVIDEAFSGKAYFLSPGQELGFDLGKGQIDIHPFDDELVQSWRNGVLIFKKAQFEQVKEKLESWYGVSIEVKGVIPKTWRFSGKFEQQMLETILNSMSNIENFDYKIKGKKVNISFKQ
ncbi:FecR domain-containing protein [Echinicola marina]|uniref:FecR family protein n=1 Tax=Echinicola marina TaxID=2859768 RepID=UPI001CF61CC4|nr:FecR family protein [Echinicola marina]UCS94041.1 FecR domain-containing protein [Echinicola marina]